VSYAARMPASGAGPGSRGFRTMVILSVAVHALALGLSVAWTTYKDTPRRLHAITVVDLIGAGQIEPPRPGPASARPAPPAPPAHERMKGLPPPPRAAAKKAPSPKEAVLPPTPKAMPLPSPGPDPDELKATIKRLRENRAESERIRNMMQQAMREKDVRLAIKGISDRVAHRVDLTHLPTPPKAGPAGSSGAAAGSPGNTRVPPELLAYFRALDEKIRSNWKISELRLKNFRDLIVEVRITIEKNGKVSDLRIQKKSGNAYFDDSVQSAIVRAAPLPLPPEHLLSGENYYEVGFRFHGDGGAS
jgi:TonB family protein